MDGYDYAVSHDMILDLIMMAAATMIYDYTVLVTLLYQLVFPNQGHVFLQIDIAMGFGQRFKRVYTYNESIFHDIDFLNRISML